MQAGEKVICLDNYFTGQKSNISKWIDHSNFELINHDIINPIELKVDKIWHLACPASPNQYQKNPINTAKVNFMGTYNMLEIARNTKAPLLLASSSEVYGDPQVHPQREDYHGHVNTTGIRSCYDEGKRISESLCFDYKRVHNCKVHVARIFNTYGPRMLPNDGRVISNFIVQALSNKPITIYGDGLQTRSFCYVDDLIEGLMRLMNKDHSGPINLGNPMEITIRDVADLIREEINPSIPIVYKSLPEDDPLKRQPDINLALTALDWKPEVNLSRGLALTINYFRSIISTI